MGKDMRGISEPITNSSNRKTSPHITQSTVAMSRTRCVYMPLNKGFSEIVAMPKYLLSGVEANGL